jgi:DNA polymerase
LGELQALPRAPLDPAPYLDLIREGAYESLDLVAEPEETVACALRSAFVARAGHRFVWGEFKALVARVFASIAGQTDLVEAFRQERDLYRQKASDIFNVSPADVSKDQWLVGKIAFLALNQPTEVKRFMETCDLWTVPITKELSETIENASRAPNPCITSLYRELQDGAVKAVAERTSVLTPHNILFHAAEEWLTMRLPSGRLLSYFQPRVLTEREYGGPGPVVEAEYYPYAGAVRTDNNGRRLAEDLVQATVQDVIMDAIARLQATGYPVVLKVDHQIVTEPENGFGSVEEVVEILCTPPSWLPGLPLAARGWERPRYR